MDKELTKNRKQTEQVLLEAVQGLVEESGFESIGINAVAARAGVSKMLIYRYFNSLDGLIAAYIRQHDYLLNMDADLPDAEHAGDFIKRFFSAQIARLRADYTLNRLYRWELNTDNAQTRELREHREEKGLWLVEAVSRLTGHPRQEVAVMATLVNASISYLSILAEQCPVYNDIHIREDAGWRQIEEGIGLLVDIWLQKR